MKTQLPYQFYTLPICKPVDAAYKHENLGEILKGTQFSAIVKLECSSAITSLRAHAYIVGVRDLHYLQAFSSNRSIKEFQVCIKECDANWGVGGFFQSRAKNISPRRPAAQI